MKKIIIHIDDAISDTEAIRLVLDVIEEGRISNQNSQYCYITQFASGPSVYADRHPKTGTDVFRVEARS
jgi:hypothetical protein